MNPDLMLSARFQSNLQTAVAALSNLRLKMALGLLTMDGKCPCPFIRRGAKAGDPVASFNPMLLESVSNRFV